MPVEFGPEVETLMIKLTGPRIKSRFAGSNTVRIRQLRAYRVENTIRQVKVYGKQCCKHVENHAGK